MRGINKAILIGRLGADPEIRYTPDGAPVANVSLATKETWRDKQTGDLQERSEWHRVTFFNRLAEIAGEHLKKGSVVYVEGRLQTRKWQVQDGTDRSRTEVVANELQMLDSRAPAPGTNGGPAATPGRSRAAPTKGSRPRTTGGNGVRPPAHAEVPAAAPEVGRDDDIPF